jgi:prevent-host-death family protein
MKKKMDATRARQEFAHTINQVAYGQHRIVVSRRGKDLAAIVPMDDLDLLKRCEEEEDAKKGRGRKAGRRSTSKGRAA